MALSAKRDRWRTTNSYVVTNAQCSGAGAYDVVLSNYLGSVTSSVAQLTVVAPPQLTVPLTNQNVLAGDSPTFVVVATNQCGGGFGYQWQLNGSTIAEATTNSYTRTNAQPADSGAYSVIVSTLAGIITNTAILTVTLPLQANYSAGPTNGYAPLTVFFTNLSTSATSYLWDFGDGNTTILVNPSNVYTNPGIYTVSLSAISGSGTNTLIRTNYIIVLSPPELVVSPALIDFGLIATGTTAQANLVVSNAGSAVLNGLATIGSGPFAVVSGSPFHLNPAQSANVSVSFSPAASGSYSNVVAFSSNRGDATNSLVGHAINAPVIIQPWLSGDNFVLSFSTTTGFNYVVQFKNLLNDPAWQSLQTFPGDGTVKTVSNSVSSASQRLYRLSVQ